jgi:hypothetical protein
MAEAEALVTPVSFAGSATRSRLAQLGRRLTATPAIPMLIALVLGFYLIDAKSFWYDEGFSVGMARLSTDQLMERLVNFEMHAAPYYLALHAWLGIGESVTVIRALSVAFGLVAVWATFYVGRRYGVAFTAALILSLSPMFIEYEQEVRAYTMLVAASAVSTLLFLRLLEQPGRLRAVLYTLSGILITYIQPLGALVVVAHAIWLAVGERDMVRVTRAQIALTFPIMALTWIPIALFALGHPEKIAWMSATTLKDVAEMGHHLAGAWLLVGVIGAMLIAGMRRDLPAAWLIVPLVGTLLVTFLIQPVHQARYLIAILPPAAIIVARNSRLVVAGYLVLSFVAISYVYWERPKADWRAAAAYVSSEVEPGDGIVFAPSFIRTTFGYYAHVGDPLQAAVPWQRSDLVGGDPDVPGILARDRIWLVRSDRPEMPGEVREALDTFAITDSRQWYNGHVIVELFEKPGVGDGD